MPHRTLILDSSEIRTLLPFHIEVDTGGRITGLGDALVRMSNDTLRHGDQILKTATFFGPEPILTWTGLIDWNGDTLRVQINSLPDVELTGHLVRIKNRAGFLLNLSHGIGFRLSTLNIASGGSDANEHTDEPERRTLRDLYQSMLDRANILNSAFGDPDENISDLSKTDSLTGCKNRQYLDGLVARECSFKRMAAVFVDIDDFSFVNERYGHHLGDQTLVNVAQMLMDSFHDLNDRKTKCEVIRFGADEFLVTVLTNHPEAQIAREVHKRIQLIQTRIKSTKYPQAVGHTLQLTAGYFVEDIRNGSMPHLIVDVATAMRMLKSGHRGETVNLNRHDHVSITNQRTIARDFSRDLADGAITFAYQPIVDCKTLSIRGFEALARWNHRTMGEVKPANFIHLMEGGPECESTTVIQIEALLGDISAMRQQGRMDRHMYTSFNLSSSQLLLPNLAEIFMDGLNRHSVSPGEMQIEVTETIQLGILTEVSVILQDLRDLGFLIALDDFGTGYSAINVALRLPIHKLKIDRSLTDNKLIHHDGRIILGNMVRMCHELGIQTVAEGIETQRQIAIAQEVGCDELQGYWFGRPTGLDDDPKSKNSEENDCAARYLVGSSSA